LGDVGTTFFPDLADVDVVRQVVDYARQRGVDVDALLDRVGIEPADLDQEGGFLDTLQWFSVQAEAASRLGDATFGCALAQHLSWRHYGLLGVLFEVSATPLVALRMLERLLPQFLPRVRFTVTEIGAVVRIRYEVEGDPALTWVHRQEVLCGMRLNPARAVGTTFAPVAVRLRQLNIPPEDLRAFFGVEVAQGAPYDEIDLPLAGVAQPSLRADADLLRHLEDAVATQLAKREAWQGRRSTLLQLDGCRIDLANGRVERKDGTVWLTSRERELLEFFAARPNVVVTHTSIERDVWKMVPSVVSHAPAVAIRRLRQKIEPKGPRPTNLLTVFGEGWKLVVRDPASA
jgi:hypothetical protein